MRRTEKGALFDRYFKALPDELSRLGVTSGWLLWLDPDFDPARSGRSASEVAKTLDPAPHAALLQSWLSFSDVWAATRDFSPFRVYLRARRSPALAAALSEEGIDYSAFFAARLLRGFLDTSLPHFQLVTLAAERALKAAGSKVAVSFFEHWSYGRAFAEGARRAGAISAAMQHASVCWEKTFHRLEPEHEFHGKPDGCAAPKPSFLFAAGAAGKAVYEESGHRPENVFLTGSARYDHICEPAAALPPRRSPLTVLLALSLEGDIEIEMIEAACIAARGADGVRLECRNYPFTRIEERPRFRRLAKEIGVTGGTLDEDLARADLILVSYSTVGEEALIAGKPVWQWLPAGYFGSGLAEAVEIPRFASPASLREALLRFAKDPALFQPTMELRRRALELLFFRGDGQAAARIAEKVKELSLKRP
ncbi:MAG: hypothetical protein NTX64_08795 [Elusimicrobia bacterium]|nr:hypothetical protein [Elusimicrobiota bacterium]